MTSSSLPTDSSNALPLLTGDSLRRWLPILVMVLAVIWVALTTENFFTPQNLINVLLQSTALGLMAMGMAAVLITGGIDLSIPSCMAFAGIVGAMHLDGGGTPLVAALLMLVVGMLVGVVNGFAIGYLNMIPFVVTLSMLAILSGAAVAVTNARSIGLEPGSPFIEGITADVAGLPLPIILMFLVMALMQVILARSLFGRWLYAVGTNSRAARVAGIPTRRVIFLAYITAGLMAGVAAIITTAIQAAAGPTFGREGVVLDVVSSAVLGGVSIYGGVGGAVNAVIGAIFITLISNSMNLNGVSYFLTLVLKGIVIIAVVALTTPRSRK
jgi:ribose/xylose/arabinose/galactoside ABC-type transport system permease subunit